MPLFGLNKKYDIPLVVGAGIIVLAMFKVGQFFPKKEKEEPPRSRELEMLRRGGKKTRSTKKYRNKSSKY